MSKPYLKVYPSSQDAMSLGLRLNASKSTLQSISKPPSVWTEQRGKLYETPVKVNLSKYEKQVCMTEPGDEIRIMATGIFAKRRRMVDRKRKTIHVKIGDPDKKEIAMMKNLSIKGDLVAFGFLIEKICRRYQTAKPNVSDQPAGASAPSQAQTNPVARSAASPCWADVQSAKETP